MIDTHPLFIPRWTKLTLEAIKKGETGSDRVHAFVLMKDKTMDFTDMNQCYIGEVYCFRYYLNNEEYCGDCDNLWAFPPEWMYKSEENFLNWKNMLFDHVRINHYKLVKDMK